MKPRDLLQYRKDPRIVVGLPLVIVLVTSFIYYLIQRANELTPEALGSRLLLFVLWNINLVLIVGVLFVLLRGLVKVLLERQRGILGSRFRAKLVATYVVISILPIALLFVIATDLLRVSIDRWFNTPVRTILENADAVVGWAEDRAMRQAAGAAREIAASRDEADQALEHVRQWHEVDLVGIYERGSVVKIVANPRSPVHAISEPPASFFDQVREGGSASRIDPGPEGKWIRVAARMPSERAAVAGIFVPAAISRMLDQSVIAWHDFQQLENQRPALKAAQTSLFLTITLAILLFALLVAIYVSRRITVPVAALAAGTRTLAQGDYGHRIGVAATDEFGVLIGSFNSMAEQLERQRQALTESNLELVEERAYLSTVLGSVSTGILAFNDEGRILSVNPAALRILEIPRPEPGTPIAEVFTEELAPLGEHLADPGERTLRSRELSIMREGEVRYLEVSASRMQDLERGAGWVVAIEDLTQLVQAQKLAAWSEAARRIAHEIKNPLTPIQLSAERIARKYERNDPDLERAVEDGCRTIVAEVAQLKRMVDEFSRFARMPAVHLRESDLGEILRDLVRLYADVKPGVEVKAEAPDTLRAVVDPEQIRRALINLLDNAIEATDSGSITVVARAGERSLLIEVSDTGRGVSESDKERLFLPYFSTKGSGTGLGLAIVHRIVHDHDGTISVHDNLPSGTRFQIEIPA
ncbi:MAG TPA: ATP-binding protein [Thermoanaerobaculia bacterium]|nr:ATP-binding protein [Thermoanaerobaculia bacterium]